MPVPIIEITVDGDASDDEDLCMICLDALRPDDGTSFNAGVGLDEEGRGSSVCRLRSPARHRGEHRGAGSLTQPQSGDRSRHPDLRPESQPGGAS